MAPGSIWLEQCSARVPSGAPDARASHSRRGLLARMRRRSLTAKQTAIARICAFTDAMPTACRGCCRSLRAPNGPAVPFVEIRRDPILHRCLEVADRQQGAWPGLICPRFSQPPNGPMVAARALARVFERSEDVRAPIWARGNGQRLARAAPQARGNPGSVVLSPIFPLPNARPVAVSSALRVSQRSTSPLCPNFDARERRDGARRSSAGVQQRSMIADASMLEAATPAVFARCTMSGAPDTALTDHRHSSWRAYSSLRRSNKLHAKQGEQGKGW